MSEINYYCLYHDLAKIILPALIEFREKTVSYPMGLTAKSWNEIIDKMIFSFKLAAEDKIPTEKIKHKKYMEGLKLFGEFYDDLWS